VGKSLIQQAVERLGPEGLARAISPDHHEALLSLWPAWARPEQLEPDGDWRVWLIIAGRAFGKSRAGAETVRRWAMQYPGCHIALVGRTAADVRDVMVRALLTPWRGGMLKSDEIPVAVPSVRALVWRNGSRATTYSAEEPNQLRGPQHDFAWCDELAAWPSSITKNRERNAGARSAMEEMWHEGVMMGLRGSGECQVPVDRTRVVVTTTPRPKKLIRELMQDATTHVTRGSTYDNAVNLPAEYIAQLKNRYDGTRIGRQELYAEILDDVPGALWTHASIDDYRVDRAPDMVRVVVGVDPSGKSDDGDEQGIVVAGKGTDGHCYILADRSTRDTPDGWGRRAVQAYIDHKADRIVAEKNYGGEMVQFVVETAAAQMKTRISYRDVTASRGKLVRAEPVSALYEQGKVHHVGEFDVLEEQMRGYVPESGRSPDRMDALVWAVTELMLGEPNASFAGKDFKSPSFTFGANTAEDDD
jgi:predicted phage terminase large subunit-like protein